MENQKSTNKPIWFTRCLIVALSILLGAMIIFSFFIYKNKGEISASLITLVLILLVVCLSEAFDKFSLGKLISLSKNVSEKEKHVTELKKENNDLRNQVINIATSLHQNQSSTNIFGLSEDIIKRITVQQASPEEVSQKENEESEESTSSQRPARKRIDRKKLEELAFLKIGDLFNFSSLNIIRDAKLVTEFHGLDPVSDYHPLYDGYVNDGKTETFIEIRPRGSYIFYDERLYMYLTKINYYKTIKKANAHLLLILINIPEIEGLNIGKDRTDDLLKKFEPAIVNGILKIKEIELNPEETKSIIDIR